MGSLESVHSRCNAFSSAQLKLHEFRIRTYRMSHVMSSPDFTCTYVGAGDDDGESCLSSLSVITNVAKLHKVGE